MHFIIRRPTDYLYPHERLVELIYGLIIALTITSAIRIFLGVKSVDIELMIVASLGAGVAWGIIDALLYLLVAIFEMHRYTRIAQKINTSQDEAEALATIKEDLEDSIVGTLDAEDQKSVYRLVYHAQRRKSDACYHCQPRKIRLTREDYFAAFQVFMSMLIATLVVVAPLLVIRPAHIAILASNVAAYVALFIVGYVWAEQTNIRKWVFGTSLVILGAILVGITLLLGG